MEEKVIRTINNIPLEYASTRKELQEFKTEILSKAIFNIKQIPNGKIVLTYGDGHTEEVSINTVLA